MTLEPGQPLLHYRLVEKIGEGGMGVVWRATDTKLGRDVAIKVLPEALSQDPERLARFEREARLLASLNHPNIAAVHGLHADAEVRFIAMELVAGEDLARRLGRERLDLRETLGYARRVAQALEAAHERGVVHRDLKPANVVVNDSGTVKVLDFGLAKAIEQPAGSDSSRTSMSPTLTSAGTAAGVILGTAAYMSPEQVRGREVDRRSDLWSFGCLVYEMLAGKPPFPGDTVSDVLAGILKEQPDWTALPAETPAPVRRLLHRCMTKDLASRQSCAADARLLLEDVLGGRYGSDQRVAAGRPSRLPWALAAIATLAAVILLWVALGTRSAAPASDPRLLSIAFPNASFLVYRLAGNTAGSLALHPAGTSLAYVGEGETTDTRRLFVRRFDEFEPRPIDGTTGSSYPAFSPDGEWIAYLDAEHVKKIPEVGGAPVTLA
ncbi:MAG: protein kinase domain-containing protein, partial [Planctomycetota bacterium]